MDPLSARRGGLNPNHNLLLEEEESDEFNSRRTNQRMKRNSNQMIYNQNHSSNNSSSPSSDRNVPRLFHHSSQEDAPSWMIPHPQSIHPSLQHLHPSSLMQGSKRGEESLNYQRLNYLRNSRSIGVLWAVFSACFTIINIIVFLQPQWLGDTESSRGTGYFGLWKSCRLLQDGQDLICSSSSLFFPSSNQIDSVVSSSPAFKAATAFIGLSVLVSMITLLSFPLFFFLHSSTVFHICGWFQLINGLLLAAGLLIFPLGWSHPQVREVCGSSADTYNPGDCSLRWTFILALIGTFDSIILSALSFLLGTRYVKLLEPKYVNHSSVKSGINSNGIKSAGVVNGAFVPSSLLPVPVPLK